MLFVQNGVYDVGFEWNNNKLYRLRFGQRTVIGGFNLCFNQRHLWIHRASTELKALSLRKRNWKMLEQDFPYFTQCIKVKLNYHYQTHIQNPLTQRKQEVAHIFENREQFKCQVMTIREKDAANRSKIKLSSTIDALLLPSCVQHRRANPKRPSTRRCQQDLAGFHLKFEQYVKTSLQFMDRAESTLSSLNMNNLVHKELQGEDAPSERNASLRT
jgi:hypothetical protein